MKEKVIYSLVVALTVYLNIMYKWELGRYILAFESVLLIFCVIQAFSLRKKVRATLHLNQTTITQGEAIKIEIRLENRSFMSAVKTQCTVKYGCLWDKRRKKLKRKITVGGKSTEYLNYKIIPSYCGKEMISVESCRVYDMFGIFSFASHKKSEKEVFVFPQLYPILYSVGEHVRNFPIEGEIYAKDRTGDDPAEIFDTREYRSGDKLQRVHWKLSAKADELFVKEYSQPVGAAVVLALEGGQLQKAEEINVFFSAAASLSESLLREECTHYVVWKNAQGELRRVRVCSEETFYEFLINFLQENAGRIGVGIREDYDLFYKGEHYCTFIECSAQCRLKVNDELLLQSKVGSFRKDLQHGEILL